MELEQIRRISLVGFLEDLGHMPVSRKGNDVWFRSLSEMREPHPSRWIRSGMSGLILASEREVTSSILPEN